jgi:4-hydroxy-3-methylbut-2-enyl diphosphate reductase
VTAEVPEGSILLIGHKGHEEVIGTRGEAPDHITLVGGPEGAASITVREESQVVRLSQITLSVDETTETADALKTKFPLLLAPPGDDICHVTQNRRTAVKELATQSELVIVVGSANSSNSRSAPEARPADETRSSRYDVCDRRPLRGRARQGVRR